MPLMLGIPVVMMDPMTWVREPRRLFDAIDRYRGTTCYMPNFGFEVAAKHAAGRVVPDDASLGVMFRASSAGDDGAFRSGDRHAV